MARARKTQQLLFTSTSTAALIVASGGLQDWHCHLDRVHTYEDRYFIHSGGGREAYGDVPLVVKQNVTGEIHKGEAFTEKSLIERMSRVIEAKIAAGETFLNAVIDCSPDVGEKPFEIALKLREKYAQRMTINVGAYAIFGLKRWGSDRQLLIEKLAPRSQFLMSLPERDARPEDKDNNVGFDGHLGFFLDLSAKHNIPAQHHLDQTNRGDEGGTKRLIEGVRWQIINRIPDSAKRPKQWAVHVISPSAYCEEEFWDMVRGLKETNIGIITCPRAALSMRQLRSHAGPMRNSIARVREFLVAGLDVRIGTDNINDIFMPTPNSPLLVREAGAEFGVIQDATRFYDQAIWDKVMRGERLNEIDLVRIEESLKGDYAASGWQGKRPWRFNGN